MPRNLRESETTRRAKARREFALQRREMGQPTEDRRAPAGAISMPIKLQNPGDALLIEAWLKNKGRDK